MPTYVGAGRQSISQDASLTRECGTQNARSATMADSSATVAAYTKGRMILLVVLVWGYCLTGCVGVLYPRAAFSRTPGSTDSLRIVAQISDSEVGDGEFSPTHAALLEAFVWADKRLDSKSSRSVHRNHDRESSLKKLLEKLTNLQQRHATERSQEGLQTTADTDRDRTNRDALIDDLTLGLLIPSTQQQSKHEGSFARLGIMPAETEGLQAVSHIDVIEASPTEICAQSPSTDPKTDAGTSDTPSPFDTFLAALNDKILRSIKPHTENGDINKRTPEQIQAEVARDTEDDKLKHPSSVYPDSYPRYIIMATSDSTNGPLSVKDTENVDKVADNDDVDISKDIPFRGVQRTAKTGTINQHAGVISSIDLPRQDVRYMNQALLVNSLIQKTVKKMEGIINKRVSQYNDVFDTDSSKTAEDIVMTHIDANTDNGESNVHSKTYISASMETLGSANAMMNDDDWKNDNTDHKRFSNTNFENEEVNEVTAAVMKAVASRMIPRDMQFWMNVSSYLDSNDYLSRTRRSPTRSKKRTSYMHLSITYGHVVPCQHKDRFYCMNGGTCVFVGALDIKTCRCPIGYTGVRCEMIDQEYILSLLTNTLIFS